MTTRAEVIEEALRWEGARWRHQGRGVNGMDCAGLVIVVANALGISDYDVHDYPPRPDGTFLSHFDDHMDRVSGVANARPGDVLIFNDHLHRCHCGIMARKHGRPSVVHAHAERRQVMHETLREAESVVGRPVRAYAFRGLED